MVESAEFRPFDDIETLRSDVLKAGVLNAKALQASAENHVANLGCVLPPSPELDEASFQTLTSIIAFARSLYGQAPIAELEAARRQALASIDRLAQLLARARPEHA
ncbi:hypothetical protein AB6806_03115 [Bosea sp. RCC_152_1]|jgi:hypothetical protein|uniref:hypothetical protein n=1 Tax=unclassified Bosea (in: a-proteobacteria) TaxID=2653178 RepID=UPI0013AECD96